jgi:PIN domain nuclease of toxin-antitoxin system
MTATESDAVPDAVVFDAEALVAYFCEEPGSDVVETYLEAVSGAAKGYISAVNLAEVHYIVRTIADEERADSIVDSIEETGIERVDSKDTWRTAADAKYRDSPALGDAFALATAEDVDGTLLVGADGDYDDIETAASISRFRSDPA